MSRFTSAAAAARWVALALALGGFAAAAAETGSLAAGRGSGSSDRCEEDPPPAPGRVAAGAAGGSGRALLQVPGPRAAGVEEASGRQRLNSSDSTGPSKAEQLNSSDSTGPSKAEPAGRDPTDELAGRAASAEAELISLAKRVALCMKTWREVRPQKELNLVAESGAAAGFEAEAESGEDYETYKALLSGVFDRGVMFKEDEALQDVLKDIEAKAVKVMAAVSDLERAVAESASASSVRRPLPVVATVSTGAAARRRSQRQDDKRPLTVRATALEEIVASLQSRVKAVEEKVTEISDKSS